MQIPFRPIALSDKPWIDELLALSDFRGAEYTFSNNFNWSCVYDLSVARFGDFIVYRMGEGDRTSYLFPAGRGDYKAVILELMEDAENRGHEFKLHGIQPEYIEQLNAWFPGKFVYQTSEDYHDYIYEVEKLQTLSGKKLHAKRNHINRFKENHPDWAYEPVTPENLDEVRAMEQAWCKENGCEENESLQAEARMVMSAIDHFVPLELSGGLIRVGGRVVAFTLGHPINSDTFGVHIEKAFADIQGAYAMINQQFAIHAMDGFQYANREEDMGEAGLRHAKHSYYPAFMYERYRARYVEA